MDTLHIYKKWLALSMGVTEFCDCFGITRKTLDNICKKHENDYSLEEIYINEY